MNRNTRRLATSWAGTSLLVALLTAPAAAAHDGGDSALLTPTGQDRLAALTESFDRDARRIIRQSQAELRDELDANLRAEFVLALTSRRALSVRR